MNAIRALNSARHLRRGAKAAREIGRRGIDDPISLIDWTPPQKAFLEDPSRLKVFRTGSQLGKTSAGLAESVQIARGRHPNQRHKPPVEVWVLTQTRSQGLSAQKKLAAMLPPRELAKGQKKWNPITGFGHHEAIVELLNGSVIRFKTCKQGGMGLSSATIHHALIDEAPEERIYAEVMLRLRATNGTLSLTFTPINRDCTYLEKLCEDGVLADLNARLTVENMTHTRSGKPRVLEDGTPVTQAWVDEQIRLSPAHEVEVTCHGAWRTTSVDRVFTAFVAETHMHDRLPEGDVDLYLGIDHGEKAGKQAAVLIAVKHHSRPDGYPIIHVLDEYRPDSITTPEQDAKAILAMLKRNDVSWKHLDGVWGDKPTGGSKDPTSKGNWDLAKALCAEMGIGNVKALHPQIRDAKRGEGTKNQRDIGIRYLHHALIRGSFAIRTRCGGLKEFFEKWKNDDRDPVKDLGDALRYSLYGLIFTKRRGPSATIRNW